MQDTTKGILWALLAVLCFGTMSLLVRAINDIYHFAAAELVFWRMMPAVLILWATARRRGDRLATPRWRLHLGRSLAGVISMMLYFYALALLPLATAATISYTSSLSLALLSFLILRERIRPLTLCALFLGLAGVVLLLRPDFSNLSKWGVAAALSSSLLAGGAYLQLRELGKLNEPAWRIVFYFTLISTVTSGLLTSLLGWQGPHWGAVPYLAGICLTSLLGQFALTNGYRLGDKFTVSALSYLTVVFIALGARFHFGEALGWGQLAAMLLIIGAGIISALPPRVKA